jgi:hypothetical protein
MDERYEDRQRCYMRIIELAREIFHELDNDFDTTWAMFARVADEIKPPADRGRPPKRSNPCRDNALIKAYSEAPRGEKRARVIEAGSAFKMSPEAAWKQLTRLRKETRDRWAGFRRLYHVVTWADDEDK